MVCTYAMAFQGRVLDESTIISLRVFHSLRIPFGVYRSTRLKCVDRHLEITNGSNGLRSEMGVVRDDPNE